jgi:hypothetical protein
MAAGHTQIIQSIMFVKLFIGLSAFAAAVAVRTSSTGCGSPLPSGQNPGSRHDAFIGDRRYVVFIPPEYSISNPAALILSYHGGSRSPENQINLDLFTSEEYNTDKFVVYPEGTSRPDCDEDDSCAEVCVADLSYLGTSVDINSATGLLIPISTPMISHSLPPSWKRSRRRTASTRTVSSPQASPRAAALLATSSPATTRFPRPLPHSPRSQAPSTRMRIRARRHSSSTSPARPAETTSP